MPIFDFRCKDCGAARTVSIGGETAPSLVLLCTDCGGEMHQAPVLKVAFMGGGRSRDLAASTTLSTTKACGHHYACRCAIKLKRPNPFRAEIDRSAGKTSER